MLRVPGADILWQASSGKSGVCDRPVRCTSFHHLCSVAVIIICLVQVDSVEATDCHVVDNIDDEKHVFWDIKEAIATLSPIVRNRLHGIPAYILDYADLIVSNQVEKPFLKPVLVTGPCTTEKWDFLQTLADEFPDVFAFPQVYTDEPADRPADPHATRCAIPSLYALIQLAACFVASWKRLRSGVQGDASNNREAVADDARCAFRQWLQASAFLGRLPGSPGNTTCGAG